MEPEGSSHTRLVIFAPGFREGLLRVLAASPGAVRGGDGDITNSLGSFHFEVLAMIAYFQTGYCDGIIFYM